MKGTLTGKMSELAVWVEQAKIVTVCAWCDPRSYPALKPDQAYSHGICEVHKQELLAKLAKRHPAMHHATP